MKKKKFKIKFTRDELVEHNKEVLRGVIRHTETSHIGVVNLIRMLGRGTGTNPVLDKFAENGAIYLFDT